MKWSTAVAQVRRLVEQCSEVARLPSELRLLQVREAWVFGDMLGLPRDLDWAAVAVCVDLPVAEVPWLTRPAGADRWAELTRASKNPVGLRWRSVHAPVWNHRIVGPLLVWDQTGGVREDALAALRQGRGAAAGLRVPKREEFVARLDDELRVSLAELQRRLASFEIDNESDANAAHCRKLCLLQVLRLAFAAHEEAK